MSTQAADPATASDLDSAAVVGPPDSVENQEIVPKESAELDLVGESSEQNQEGESETKREHIEIQGSKTDVDSSADIETSPVASTSAKRKRGRPRNYGQMLGDLEDGRSSGGVKKKQTKLKHGVSEAMPCKTPENTVASVSTPRRGSRTRKPPAAYKDFDEEKVTQEKDNVMEDLFDNADKSGKDSDSEKMYKACSSGSPLKKKEACDVCHKLYSSTYLPLHMQTHEKNRERPFKCEKCGKSFMTSGALKLHGGLHTDERPWVCDTCGASFRQKGNLHEHKRIHERKEGQKEYICDVCGKQFHAKRTYQGHMKFHAGVFDETCKICSRKFVDKETLRVHMRSHKTKDVICDVCGEVLGTLGTLRNHKLIHTGEKPYQCEVCKKRFRNITTYKRHLTTHSEERPYICDVCGLAFKWRLYLLRHQFVHYDIKNFQCDQCEKAFKRKEHLKLHLRTHTGERPYVCRYCAKRFSQSCSLRQHEGIHEKRKDKKMTQEQMEVALGVKWKGNFDMNCKGIEIISKQRPEWKEETGKMYVLAKDIVHDPTVTQISKKVKRVAKKQEVVDYDDDDDDDEEDDDDDDFDDFSDDERSEEEIIEDSEDEVTDEEVLMHDPVENSTMSFDKSSRTKIVAGLTSVKKNIPTATKVLRPLLDSREITGKSSVTDFIPQNDKSSTLAISDVCAVEDHIEEVEIQTSMIDDTESSKVDIVMSPDEGVGDRVVYFLTQPGSNEPVSVILDNQLVRDAHPGCPEVKVVPAEQTQELKFILPETPRPKVVNTGASLVEARPVVEEPAVSFPSRNRRNETLRLPVPPWDQLAAAVSSIQDAGSEEEFISIAASPKVKVETTIIDSVDSEPLKIPDPVIQVDSSSTAVNFEGPVQTYSGTLITLTSDQLDAFLNSSVSQSNPEQTKTDISNDVGIKFIKIEGETMQTENSESLGHTKIFTLPSGRVLHKDGHSPQKISEVDSTEPSGPESTASDNLDKELDVGEDGQSPQKISEVDLTKPSGPGSTACNSLDKEVDKGEDGPCPRKISAVGSTELSGPRSTACNSLDKDLDKGEDSLNKVQSSECLEVETDVVVTCKSSEHGGKENPSTVLSKSSQEIRPGVEQSESVIEAAQSLVNFMADVAKRQANSEPNNEEKGKEAGQEPDLEILSDAPVSTPKKRGRKPGKASAAQTGSKSTGQGKGRILKDKDVKPGVDYDEKTGKCLVCGKTYKNFSYLIQHTRMHKGLETKYSCRFCQKNFPSAGNLRLHMSVHEPENKMFECAECGHKFAQKANLEDHQRIHRRKKGEKDFYCEDCGKGFNSKSHMHEHKKIHSGRMDFMCQKCGKTFVSRHAMRNHMVSHDEAKNWICDTCGARLKTASALKIHSRIHTGEKPYSCSTCGKSFYDKSTLLRHESTHSDERPYVCTLCGLSFKWKLYLTRHMIVHTGVMNFKCSECDKAFKRREHLKLHMRTHTGEKPYKCNYCQQSFSQTSSRRIHERTHLKDKTVLLVQ